MASKRRQAIVWYLPVLLGAYRVDHGPRSGRNSGGQPFELLFVGNLVHIEALDRKELLTDEKSFYDFNRRRGFGPVIETDEMNERWRVGELLCGLKVRVSSDVIDCVNYCVDR